VWIAALILGHFTSSVDVEASSLVWKTGTKRSQVRLLFAYAIGMGEMKRQIAWENEQSSRYASTVAICASIIAAVRLARDDISGSSPKLTCAVADSVHLARVILKRVLAR
jgi:hypothetical protein